LERRLFLLGGFSEALSLSLLWAFSRELASTPAWDPPLFLSAFACLSPELDDPELSFLALAGLFFGLSPLSESSLLSASEPSFFFLLDDF
jgi:hypothetical protein